MGCFVRNLITREEIGKILCEMQEDGEGPSNREPKHPWFGSLSDEETGAPPSEYEAGAPLEYEARAPPAEYEEEEQKEEEVELRREEDVVDLINLEEEEDGAECYRRAIRSVTSVITINLPKVTDTEVLDCSICCEALNIPVFQCENGHIACSTCCIKLVNKCPCCGTLIGHRRCRAIERVLEAVEVRCGNSMYGCREVFRYCKKQGHEKTCSYAPCSCPIADCDYKSSSKQLSKHFSDVHMFEATRFNYDNPISLTIRRDEKFHILQEERDGALFILYNEVQTLGNVVSLGRIGPSIETGFFYELNAKAQPVSSNLRLQSFTKSTPSLADNQSSLGFLLVPNMFSYFPKLCIEINVRDNGGFPNDVDWNSDK